MFNNIHAIIGLGNPGSKYEDTRHNIGFSVVDGIAKKGDLKFIKGKGDFFLAVLKDVNSICLLVKPVTFMNNSGFAVKQVIELYHLLPSDILIVVDDFNLTLGKIRLRSKGSDGGHNGLASIIQNLQSNDFPRMRCGIGSDLTPEDKDMKADFVLSPFSRDEKVVVSRMVEKAGEIALIMIRGNIESARNKLYKM